MNYCPTCERIVDTQGMTCPYCETELQHLNEEQNEWWQSLDRDDAYIEANT